MPKPYSNRYQSNDEEDEEQPSREKKKEVPPRFIKNQIDKVDTQQIVVNLSKTHYDVIQLVVEQLGWVAEYSSKSQAWDIMWTDAHIGAQDLFRLNDHQKISHFPAIEVLSRKNYLGKSLMKVSKSFPQSFNFFPPTWSVPSEIGELMRFDTQQPEEKAVYIFKPESSSQGKGISLLTSLQQIEGKVGIVQTYINNPYLIENLKFDLRIYVLIYGCDPTRIYLYEEGLARFATETYQKAKKKNMKDNYVHLTNYAINKNNKKFIFNNSEQQMHLGHKRSLTSVFNTLRRRHVDVEALKTKIDSLIVKTLLVGKPMINHLYGLSQTDNLANDHCFHILGFDVMLDQHAEPFLLEVNHTPSFATDTPLDKSIKLNLIKETLLLLNVNLQSKKVKVQQKKQFDEKRAMRKLTKLTPEQRAQQKKVIEKEKNAHQMVTLKRYRKLYPLEVSQHCEVEECAQRIFNEQNGLKHKEIKQSRQPRYPGQMSVKVRPRSIQQIGTEAQFKKIKQRVVSSKASESTVILPDSLDRLPNISSHIKPSSIHPQKAMLKSYEFKPQAVFAQHQQKIALQKLFIQQRISAGQNRQSPPIVQERCSDIREGNYVEPRLLNLTDSIPKSLRAFQDQAIDLKSRTVKNEEVKPKAFFDFNSLSAREQNCHLIPNQRSPVLIRKTTQKKKDHLGKSPNRYFLEVSSKQTEEYLWLKSQLATKSGNRC